MKVIEKLHCCSTCVFREVSWQLSSCKTLTAHLHWAGPTGVLLEPISLPCSVSQTVVCSPRIYPPRGCPCRKSRQWWKGYSLNRPRLTLEPARRWRTTAMGEDFGSMTHICLPHQWKGNLWTDMHICLTKWNKSWLNNWLNLFRKCWNMWHRNNYAVASCSKYRKVKV